MSVYRVRTVRGLGGTEMITPGEEQCMTLKHFLKTTRTKKFHAGWGD